MRFGNSGNDDRYITIKEKRLHHRRKIQIITILIAVLVIIALAVIFRLTRPVITMVGDAEMTLEYKVAYVDPGVSAKAGTTDISDRIEVVGEVDDSKLGDYTLQYRVKHGLRHITAERLVHVIDTTAPEITLKGDEKVIVDSIEEYKENGASAKDNHDGDLTKGLKTEQKQISDYEYTITYTVTDSNGNVGTASRAVVIKDKVPPVITLEGDAKISIDYGTRFTDPGAKAEDARDGDLTEKLTVEGYVDIYKPGTYTLVYKVADSCDNEGIAKRKVKVKETVKNPKHAIYLTFDDGPSDDVTVQILDTLKKNGIKATFFICDYSKDKKKIIKRMVKEGHTIGIHGKSHDYSKIYKNEEAFLENINSLKDKVKEDTGYEAYVIRFPGGSSNTISKEYAPGLMTTLVQDMTDQDMMYLDWNVDSGDARGNNEPVSYLYDNIVSTLHYDRSNVILMHDTSAKKTTAQMLQSLIDYATEEGYSFLPVEKDTVPVHHTVNN